VRMPWRGSAWPVGVRGLWEAWPVRGVGVRGLWEAWPVGVHAMACEASGLRESLDP
jgi:hypothetical protein